MIIMMMTIIMLGVGDYNFCYRGRCQIDISDHTHCTHILQCRFLVFGSFAILSSLASMVISLRSRYATHINDARRQ